MIFLCSIFILDLEPIVTFLCKCNQCKDTRRAKSLSLVNIEVDINIMLLLEGREVGSSTVW